MTSLPTLGPRGEGWVAIQLVLLAAIALAGPGGGPAWSGVAGAGSLLLGSAAMIVGGLLAVRGVLDLRAALTPFPYPRAGTALVDSGAYRLVRHPIYGGLVVGSAGWGLAWASPIALVLAAALFGFLSLKSRREEAWLAEQFPEYEAYRRRTRRLIPFIH